MPTDIEIARSNVLQQLVDGAPNTITPSKLRQLIIDIVDALASKSSPFSKVDATTNPTVNDDGVNSSGNGTFVTGSKWYNQVDDEVHLCLISTTAAAVWVPITLSIDELGSAAVLNVGTSANEIVQLDNTGKLPAFDGSQLTNLPSLSGLGALAALNEVPDDSITTAKIPDDAVTPDKLADTAVTAGSYTNADFTVDAQGRVTAASDGTSIAAEQLCTAWVSFDGTGTVSIFDSYNVSSITDLGTGNYRVNFSTAMLNANYCAISGSSDRSYLGKGGSCINDKTTAYLDVRIVRTGYGGYDEDIVTVAVFGGVA